MLHGLEGYGLYFFCLELIARTVEKHNLTFELEHDAEIISHRVGIHRERVEEMMRCMVDLGLFENDRGVITCLKMATRTDEYTQKLVKESNILPMLSRQSPDSIPTMSDLIEEKEEKRKTSRRFTPPTHKEVSDYCRSRDNGVNPVDFLNHYDSVDWMRGKTKIKDWKACVRTWEKNSKKPSSDDLAGAI